MLDMSSRTDGTAAQASFVINGVLGLARTGSNPPKLALGIESWRARVVATAVTIGVIIASVTGEVVRATTVTVLARAILLPEVPSNIMCVFFSV